MQCSDKVSLRRHYASLRESLPEEARAVAEDIIRKQLFALPAWRTAALVCGYVSMRGEIDMAPVWDHAIAEGKAYALPVTISGAREGQMIFRRTAGFSPETLVPARFGVREPSETCPVLAPAEFAGAVILVPGLTFDDSGFRIGYGGGYYDRFLASLRDSRIPVTTVGLTFADCRTSLLPREAYDIPVDYVIDERRITASHGIRT